MALSSETGRLVENPSFVLDRLPTNLPIMANSTAYYLGQHEDGSLFANQGNFDIVGILLLRLCVRNMNSASVSSRYDGYNFDQEESTSSGVGTRLLLHSSLVYIHEFKLEAGQKSAFHTHSLPYLFVNIPAGEGPSSTQELNKTGEPVAKEVCVQRDWDASFVDENHLGQHAAENVGSSLFLQFVVEFLRPVNNRRVCCGLFGCMGTCW